MSSVICSKCQKAIAKPSEGCGTGYATNDKNETICYDCCAAIDRQYMIKEGRITLYLNCEPAHYAKRPEGRKSRATINNWPGSLKFEGHSRTGHHNIARVRYDIWFKGPDGFEWHGVTYGDNTQICHCKRTKRLRS